jgi:hypothetical protein
MVTHTHWVSPLLFVSMTIFRFQNQGSIPYLGGINTCQGIGTLILICLLQSGQKHVPLLSIAYIVLMSHNGPSTIWNILIHQFWPSPQPAKQLYYLTFQMRKLSPKEAKDLTECLILGLVTHCTATLLLTTFATSRTMVPNETQYISQHIW